MAIFTCSIQKSSFTPTSVSLSTQCWRFLVTCIIKGDNASQTDLDFIKKTFSSGNANNTCYIAEVIGPVKVGQTRLYLALDKLNEQEVSKVAQLCKDANFKFANLITSVLKTIDNENKISEQSDFLSHYKA